MDAPRWSLSADTLHARCDPETLGFSRTDELEPLAGTLGQDDALAALEFGLAMRDPGFNIFVLGPDGSGRMTAVRRTLRERAAEEPTPSDWCYVVDFADPRRPAALELPAGRAPELQDQVGRLMDELRRVLPETLESDDVATRRMSIVNERARAADEAVEACRREIQEDPHVALIAGGEGFTVVPARGGEALTEEAFRSLPESHRDEIHQRMAAARDRINSLQRLLHQLRRETGAEVEAFHKEVAGSVVRPRLAALREAFREVPSVVAYLDGLEEDILEHVLRLAERRETPSFPFLEEVSDGDFAGRYDVNVLVTHEPGSGAPVVEEPNPTLKALLGQVEGRMRFGVMVTDFTRIVAGAAQRANGGYLVLEARELLARPFAWSALKRALRTGELRPADPGSEMGLTTLETLEPRPVPTRLRVILVGQPTIFYLLKGLDPHFDELFKVKVDFAGEMNRTPESERGLAAWIARECQEGDLLPVAAGAVGRLVEEATRATGDQRKLTTRLHLVRDRLVEAERVARDAGLEAVELDQVEAAVQALEFRESRPHRELLELIERGVLAFDPKGTEAGQLHGIAVLYGGGLAFGRPIRVLASAYAGKEGVVNIERETDLSGPIHNKGFLVLSGYLGRKFARTYPLILSASLSFDQLYEEVEGDSASAAELYALLSAIGEIPLQQGIGVTGAINQEGLLLPVGGVTHKVEGFYAACQRKGLTGEQGVLLPRRNVENLVVRREVREAVAEGRFHVWAVDSVEEGWPILCGKVAGEADAEGEFVPGSVYRAVQDRLREWAETAAAMAGEGALLLASGSPEPLLTTTPRFR
ncbi:MAG: AAA family ATPase [Gemmatimonadales bacterium]|nr:MAG: AAA family ATPase [Gemmatimonadales bacterium]